ncbi:M1 family metallopeptidase [Abyssalbus ytuae]|uniref:M1 family metallopeptidase n=1 Tax=Abyssalbus ytuae TaxID=2926907 RepID=A0A9E7D4W5_9FLAO|nr:M1 family metallopeptidase [Abyssalbus ytuae]UOB19389.1 M1 family metallopeptidase [Abyssalbus ytuae]
MKKFFVLNLSFIVTLAGFASNGIQKKKPDSNPCYWQQHVNYNMEIDMNVENYQYSGIQKLKYTNNSPDTLNTVFYHLYFNAFQPGSEMDVRSRTIADPDSRVKDRISKLLPSETGFIKVKSLKQDGTVINHKTEGTVLEVELSKPILPGKTVEFDMEFNGQVPLQIRRSGRDNKEGVALSMTQWYPKIAEYDFEGWHADPYIGREFHGVWGDFDVKITIDKNYVLGGSGYLQNANDIGYGYEKEGIKVKKPKGKKLTWHFVAPNVHDFTWAADPDYIHEKVQVENGPMLHFLYKNKPSLQENWKKLQPKAVEMIQFYGRNIGKYPYDQYSIIQGGDGGMEYAMCTLITGERSFGSLVGVTAHEMAHSWFQHVLATNEAKYEWMDEGFTSFISNLCENEIMGKNEANPFKGAYQNYIYLANSGAEQPQTTHADRYNLNQAYGISAYSKGEVFLAQLGYVMGTENLMKTIRRYFNEFKFKHPVPNDIKRVAEKVSGMQLDWYLVDWTQTTNTIDYSIKSVEDNNVNTTITLERIGLMPMPVDLVIFYEDGTQEYFYIPLRMMRGEKPNPYESLKRTVLDDWAWAYPTYEVNINKPKTGIKAVVIDPSELMADVKRENNIYQQDE